MSAAGARQVCPGRLCLVTAPHYLPLSILAAAGESCAVARAVMPTPQMEVTLRPGKGLCRVESIDLKSVLLLPDLLNSIV